jgi:hypothetical protein
MLQSSIASDTQLLYCLSDVAPNSPTLVARLSHLRGEPMNRFAWSLAFSGVTLLVIGCFLPWSCRGDLIWACTPGVQIDTFLNHPILRNNGGLSLLFFGTIILFCLGFSEYRRPAIGMVLTIASATLLTLMALYRVVSAFVWQFTERDTIGGFTIQAGLFVMLSGALMLCMTSGWMYRTARQSRQESGQRSY